jgi:hypothetical protein
MVDDERDTGLAVRVRLSLRQVREADAGLALTPARSIASGSDGSFANPCAASTDGEVVVDHEAIVVPWILIEPVLDLTVGAANVPRARRRRASSSRSPSTKW